MTDFYDVSTFALFVSLTVMVAFGVIGPSITR